MVRPSATRSPESGGYNETGPGSASHKPSRVWGKSFIGTRLEIGRRPLLGKGAIRGKIGPVRAAFTLIELLVVIAIIAVLAGAVAGVVPQIVDRAASADALAKTRRMGAAVLLYPADHNGVFPPLFPGQVLEYEEGRGGRIVTECADYLGIEPQSGKYFVETLMPRAYARLDEPKDKNAMRVYVMNTAITNNGTVINPFGRVTTPGKPPTGNSTPASLAGVGNPWMISTADQKQPNVASAPWRNNTPPEPPLENRRAVFRFDGAGELQEIDAP